MARFPRKSTMSSRSRAPAAPSAPRIAPSAPVQPSVPGALAQIRDSRDMPVARRRKLGLEAWISAPFWDDDRKVRRWNVARAALLGVLASVEGYRPRMVHLDLWFREADDLADPAGRAAGLQRSCELAAGVASRGGRYFGLSLPSGRCSEGSLLERAAWIAARPEEAGCEGVATWAGYALRMEEARLLREWAALRTPETCHEMALALGIGP